MMSKRGAESQSGREGSFNGDGSGTVQTDMPKQATAAQMAARKIKALKGRKPVTPGRASSPGAAPVQNSFNGFSAGAAPATSQSFPPANNQPQQNGAFGGTNASFGGFNSNFDFNFNPSSGQSTSAYSFSAGGDGSGSQPPSQASVGGVFNFGGAASNTTPAAATTPFGFGSNNQTLSTSVFGAPATTQSANAFEASTSKAPVFGGFGAPTSTASAFNFGSTTADEQPSNIFRPATSASQPSNAAPSTNLFGTSTSDASTNPFGLGNQSSPAANPFGPAQPSTPSTGLFGTSKSDAPTVSASSNPFAGLKAAQPESSQTPAKPLFAAKVDPQTPAHSATSTTFGSFTAPQASNASSNLFGASASQATAQTPGPSKPAFSFSGLNQPAPSSTPSANLFGQQNQASQVTKLSANTGATVNGALTNGETPNTGTFSFLNSTSQSSSTGLFGQASNHSESEAAKPSQEKTSSPTASSPFSNLPRSPERPKSLELPKQGFTTTPSPSRPATSFIQSAPQPVNGSSIMFGSLSNPPAMTNLTGSDATASSRAQPNSIFGSFGGESPAKTTISSASPANGISTSNPFASLSSPSKPAEISSAPMPQQAKPLFTATPVPSSFVKQSATMAHVPDTAGNFNSQQNGAHHRLLQMRELNAGLLAYLAGLDGTMDFSPILDAYKQKVIEIQSKQIELPQEATASSATPFNVPASSTVSQSFAAPASPKRKNVDEPTPSPKKPMIEQRTSPSKGSKTAGVMERLFNDFDASKGSGATNPADGHQAPATNAAKPSLAQSGPPKFNVGKSNFLAQFTKQAATDDSDDSDDEKPAAPPPKIELPKFNVTPSNFMASFSKQAKASQDSDSESDSEADEPEVKDTKRTSRQASLAPSNALFQSSRNASPTPSTNGGTSIFDSPQPSSAFNNPFAKYSPAPSGNGDNDDDNDSENDEQDEEHTPSGNAGRSLFDRVSRDNSGSDSADSTPLKPSPAGDRTWNPNTPIKFANAASTSATPSLFGFTSGASTPAKTPFGNSTLPTFNFGAPSPSPVDSENKENTNQETPKPLFQHSASASNIFASTSKSASYLNPNGPSVFSSANTSRASTPGATTDGDSGAEDSSAAPEHTQDEAEGAHEDYRTALSVTELAENDVLFEISKSKVQKVAGGKYEDVGTGPLRLLRNKQDGKVRVLMRKLNGRVAINSHLIASGRYAVEARKPNTLWASFFDEAKPATFYITFAKAATSEAKEFIELCNANKPTA